MTPDAELVLAWQRGEQAAGEALFERCYEGIARFFFNKLSGGGQDLIQNTFLACAKNIAGFRGDSSFRSYLYAIAYRQLCLHFRKQRRERERLDFTEVSAHDLGPSPSNVVAKREELRLLLAALRRIPLAHQIVLELHYWDAMKTAEIAEVLAIPVGTVRGRLRRGRALLEDAVTKLASSRDVLESTLGGLERWCEEIRAKV